MVEPLTPTEAGLAAVDATGTCQVCREQVPLRLDGIPRATHKWTVLLNPDAAPEHQLTSVSDCPGSNLPPIEYAEAYEAARFA